MEHIWMLKLVDLNENVLCSCCSLQYHIDAMICYLLRFFCLYFFKTRMFLFSIWWNKITDTILSYMLFFMHPFPCFSLIFLFMYCTMVMSCNLWTMMINQSILHAMFIILVTRGFKALKQTVKLYYRLGRYKEMMEAYREMLTYIKSAVTRNYSEKCINSIMDYVSGSASQNFGLLQEFYQTTLRALEEAKNEVNSFWQYLRLTVSPIIVVLCLYFASHFAEIVVQDKFEAL